jgi:hypothetical protein
MANSRRYPRRVANNNVTSIRSTVHNTVLQRVRQRQRQRQTTTISRNIAAIVTQIQPHPQLSALVNSEPELMTEIIQTSGNCLNVIPCH